MSLPKYISYWYIQDSIKKATRDCMYHGMNSPQCKASWKEVECVEAYFTDRFNEKPVLTRNDTQECIKKIDYYKYRNANLCKDTDGKDSDT